MPVVLSNSATCDCVFLPDVPRGTYPTVMQRTIRPKNEIIIAQLPQKSPTESPNLVSSIPDCRIAITKTGMPKSGK